MSKNDVDDLLGEEGDAAPDKASKKKAAAAPAKKAAAAPAKKAAAKPAAKAAPVKKAAATVAPAKKVKAKAKDEDAVPTSEVKIALAKVKKAISYADFAEKNDFQIRTVRRAAREMRDNGDLQLTKEGQIVMISAAV